jgi:branched-chain amino acid transport system permease protein
MDFARWKKALAGLLVPAGGITIIIVIIGLINNVLLASVAIAMLVNLTLVVGTYIFSGNSGVVSFGQLSFMAIGAYSSALVSIPVGLKHVLLPNLVPWLGTLQVGFVTSVAVGALVAGVAAFIIGFPLSRLSGIQAGIASLALLLVVQTVASHWDDVTDGTQTMIGIPADLTLWPALVLTLISLGIAFAYQRSRFGLRMRAAREDELAAVASGISVARERHRAFALSGLVCGIGGAMSAHYLGALSSTLDSFFTPTYLTIAMLVIGGLFSLYGAVVGTVFVTIIVELLRRFELGVPLFGHLFVAPAGVDQVVLGVLLLLTLFLRPNGLTGSTEAQWPRLASVRRTLRERTSTRASS